MIVVSLCLSLSLWLTAQASSSVRGVLFQWENSETQDNFFVSTHVDPAVSVCVCVCVRARACVCARVSEPIFTIIPCNLACYYHEKGFMLSKSLYYFQYKYCMCVLYAYVCVCVCLCVYT